jgi:hypothetical protein
MVYNLQLELHEVLLKELTFSNHFQKMKKKKKEMKHKKGVAEHACNPSS